jgi:hypothetical protein
LFQNNNSGGVAYIMYGNGKNNTKTFGAITSIQMLDKNANNLDTVSKIIIYGKN